MQPALNPNPLLRRHLCWRLLPGTALLSCLTLTFFLLLLQRAARGDATLTVSCSPATCARGDC